MDFKYFCIVECENFYEQVNALRTAQPGFIRELLNSITINIEKTVSIRKT